MRTLEGGCSAPVAAHAHINEEEGIISLEGGVWSLDGTENIREQMQKKLQNADDVETEAKKQKTGEFASVVASGSMLEKEMKIAVDLGEELAKKLLEKGAGEILAKAKEDNKV